MNIKLQDVTQQNDHTKEQQKRPWGSYWVLKDDEHCKVKMIEVLPKQRLSYQKHAHRSEHWFIVHGEALVTLDGQEISLKAGQAVDISVGTAHRIANPNDQIPLRFVEVQLGSYFGEDDIVRLSDDYGRR